MKTLILTLSTLIVSSALMGQTVLYHEDFDGANPSVSTYAANGTSTWALTTSLQNSGTHSDSAQVVQSDSLFLETDAINATSYAFLELKFNHICKVDFFDAALLQVSVDSGLSWTTLSGTEYLGSGNFFQDKFSSVSYNVWQAGQSSATPTNSWWKAERFELSSLAANTTNLKIRFVLIDEDNTGAMGNYGWLVDDIEIIGSTCELIPPTIQITGTNYQGTVYDTGPYLVQADVQDASGLDTVELAYSVNNGPKVFLQMQNTSGNTYEDTIPAMNTNDSVCYYIRAKDATSCGGNVGFYPTTSCNSFIVSNSPPPICVGSPVNNFDYSETFATFTPGNGTNTVGTLNNNWENDLNDSHDWWVYNQGTGSGSTGPPSDHSPGDANYLYVEASGSYSNKTAILNAPCYDLKNLTAPRFSFWYHMYGSNMGSLEVEIYFRGRWTQLVPLISGNQGNQWNYLEVDLSAYVGSFVKLRFVANTGAFFQSDIAIDDIAITIPPANELSLKGVFSPTPLGCSGSAQEYLTVTLENLGSSTQNVVPMAYQLNNGAIVRDTLRATVAPNNQVNFTFQQTVNMSASGSYSFNFWHELAGDAENYNDSIKNYLLSSRPSTLNFPDTTDFENFTVGTPGVFASGWENSPNDSYDWFVHSGATNSTNTGPSGDHTTGLGKYLYVEATSNFNVETSVLSKCYDISNLNKPEVKFSYHMLGQFMGDLHLDISVNGIVFQDIMPVISGNQGSSWNDLTVDLTPYRGVVKLIFRGVTGSSYTSDIAIDDVILHDAQPVGLNDDENTLSSEEWEIYPNPNKGTFHIRGLERETILKVYNNLGKVVHTVRISNETDLLNLGYLSDGLYFIEAIKGNERSVKRMIVH